MPPKVRCLFRYCHLPSDGDRRKHTRRNVSVRERTGASTAALVSGHVWEARRREGAVDQGKRTSPAAEMKKFRTMTASDEFTTARVVAQPTPSLPPNVLSPDCELTIGIAAP